MKTFLLLLAIGIMALGQSSSPTVGDVQKVLTDAQMDAATIANLQAQLVQVGAITTACPDCLTALSTILAGATVGQYSGIELCCGPTTVPATPSGSFVLYIFQNSPIAVAAGR